MPPAPSSFGLEDKVAIVTGASQGIGRALALGLARNGAHVALASLNVDRAEQVKAEIEAMGRKSLVVRTDLLHVSQIRAMTDQVHSHFGRIDILVNNADWTGTTPAVDVTEEEWDRTLDISLKGLFFACQSVARVMIPQGHGKIINLGSTFGVVGFGDKSVYAAAKAGVHHLTRVLALEWAPHQINVNAVAPCITQTPSRRNILDRPGYKEWATGKMLPIGRWNQPEDLVGAVLFLSSHLSDMVVGHVLMVDGGWTLH
jgi:Dehydrogenases with different specificities (related to short-chain alcohol dehydrogenases)